MKAKYVKELDKERAKEKQKTTKPKKPKKAKKVTLPKLKKKKIKKEPRPLKTTIMFVVVLIIGCIFLGYKLQHSILFQLLLNFHN